jgi:hypothetical protein
MAFLASGSQVHCSVDGNIKSYVVRSSKYLPNQDSTFYSGLDAQAPHKAKNFLLANTFLKLVNEGT